MTDGTKAILQWGPILIGVGLLIVSVTAYLDGSTGRLPSAIAFGACGWMLLPVALGFGRRKNGDLEQNNNGAQGAVGKNR